MLMLRTMKAWCMTNPGKLALIARREGLVSMKYDNRNKVFIYSPVKDRKHTWIAIDEIKHDDYILDINKSVG